MQIDRFQIIRIVELKKNSSFDTYESTFSSSAHKHDQNEWCIHNSLYEWSPFFNTNAAYIYTLIILISRRQRERERAGARGGKGAVVHVLHFKIKWRIDYLSFEWNILVSSILLPTMMWKEWKIMLSILNNVLLKTKLGREEVKKRGREKWIEERSEASSGGYLLPPRSQISLAPFPFAIP